MALKRSRVRISLGPLFTSAGVLSDLAAIWERPGESPKRLYQTTTTPNSPVIRVPPERYVSEGIIGDGFR